MSYEFDTRWSTHREGEGEDRGLPQRRVGRSLPTARPACGRGGLPAQPGKPGRRPGTPWDARGSPRQPARIEINPHRTHVWPYRLHIVKTGACELPKHRPAARCVRAALRIRKEISYT